MLVKNGVVKMDWDVEDFFETHADGYVAATQTYDTINGECTIIFKDRCAFFLIDDGGNLLPKDGIVKELKAAFKEDELNYTPEEYWGDSYVEVGMQGIITMEGVLEGYGFSEDQIQDVIDRMVDLEQYFEVTYQDM